MIHQTPHALRRLTPPVPYQAGMVATALFEYTPKVSYVAATDIVEMGSIPPGARIVGAKVLGTTAFSAAATVDVGIMDGEPGDGKDDTRDLTSELLFDDAAIDDAEAEATFATCMAIAVSDAERAIGVKFSANQGTGGVKKLTLALSYTY